MAFTRATKEFHAPLSWSRDHLVPVSKGGKAGMNIVLAHFKCNTERGNADPTQEMLERAARLWHQAAQLTYADVKHVEKNPVFKFGQAAVNKLYPTEFDPKFIP